MHFLALGNTNIHVAINFERIGAQFVLVPYALPHCVPSPLPFSCQTVKTKEEKEVLEHFAGVVS